MDIMETIKDQIENNRVILYMKGSQTSRSAVFQREQCRRSWAAVRSLPMSMC